MSLNYKNLGKPAVHNTLPIFTNMANASAPKKHPTFMPQFVSEMQTTEAGGFTRTSNRTLHPSNPRGSFYTRKRRSETPEAPPAPRLSECFDHGNNTSMNEKPDQGAQPMDLENDLEVVERREMQAKLNQQLKIPSADSSLMLNSLLTGGVNPTAAGYMFFPAAASSMLMDHTSMMAAAMQQMQSYGGFMPTTATNSNATEGTLDATDAAFSGQPVRETITTKHCTLIPPNLGAPPPTVRERPLGCRTVFVGGLPEAITEEMIHEIFDSCGEITTLRMSKKNFCHIRFRLECSVDRAIFLSGYRVRISDSSEPVNLGRLHVDYAQARDDQYEYECKQRQLQREQRHRDRSSPDHRRSQSPPPIPHYTDHEASLVAESLRSTDSFIKAVQTISVWLERGDCSKRNANIFYSMIQSTHSHVRRLHSEKQLLEEELKKARECYRKQMLVMSKQFTQIEKVFNAASHKKVWDHFSKAQRKNIDQWKKLASELRSIQIEDDEMEMSDEDREAHSGNSKRAQYEHLKEENDSLRCQLDALRHEMSMERSDIKGDSDFREKQIKVLRETIRNMQTQMLQMKTKEQQDSKTIEQLERKLKESAVKQLLLKTKLRQTTEKKKDRGNPSSRNSEASEQMVEEPENTEEQNMKENTNINVSEADKMEQKQQHENKDRKEENAIDVEKTPDDIEILEDPCEVIEIADDVHIAEKSDEPNVDVSSKTSAKTKITKAKSSELPENTTKATLNTGTDDKRNSLLLTEARIIALVASFLIVHPTGVSIDYICSYLRNFIKCELDASNLADILNKYNNLFKATPQLENNASKNVIITWSFCGYTGNTLDGKKGEENQKNYYKTGSGFFFKKCSF